MDHDQRFKALLRENFADFLRLFFAEQAEQLDLSSVEWLDKEVFGDAPEGSRHVLDLVARLQVEQSASEEEGSAASLILLDVEIESPDRTTSIKPRLPHYYQLLRETYQLPVLPIVLYLRVGLDGIGVDDYVEEVLGIEVLRLRYLYVGLRSLDAIEYLQGENWLGVALSALMRVESDQVAWLAAEALRRLVAAPLSDQQRFLLVECVQAYLSLDEQQQQQYDQILRSDTYEGVRAMNKTVYEQGIEKGIEQGIEKGIEQGIEKGRLRLVEESLKAKFGEVSEQVRERLEQMTTEDLIQLNLKIPTATSLAELGLPEV